MDISNYSEEIEDKYEGNLSIPDGVGNLITGYMDYAEDVIIGRALPDIRDGLKPSQRRLMYTAYCDKDLTKNEDGHLKSATLCGLTMRLHPHGDATIYQTLVPMTQKNGTMITAPFKGQGNFGKFNLPDPPAASRYTVVGLNPIFWEYFKGVDGVNYLPSIDNSTTEPEVLPVSFPAVLCNYVKGVAVGFATNSPSFNFDDVIDLTIEYLRDGECHTIICPDFVDGGYYIKNVKELTRLMTMGTARLKMRGKMYVDGKEIKMKEFPCGVPLNRVQKQINALNLPIKGGVASDYSDLEKGVELNVECTSKNRVDEVINSIYRGTQFQNTITFSVLVIHNGVPRLLGVWDVIKEWCEWRKSVVIKTLSNRIEPLKVKMKECSAFMQIINDTEKKNTLVDIITKTGGSKKGIEYIIENWGFEYDLAKWVVKREVDNFFDGGKYKEQYDKAMAELEDINNSIANISETLIKELTEIKRKFKGQFPRKTEISTVDYDYIVEEKVDETECYYVIRDNFILKSNIPISTQDNDIVLHGKANEVFVLIDNRGRVCRIYCEDIPYTMSTGIYLPKYFELEETEDCRIVWVDKLQPVEKTIIYKDGNIGFIDFSEWCDNKRKVKVVPNGVAQAYANIIGCVIDTPEVIVCCTDTLKFAYLSLTNFKKKARTAKSRGFTLAKGERIVSFGCLTLEETLNGIGNLDCYSTKPVPLVTEYDLAVDIQWQRMM